MTYDKDIKKASSIFMQGTWVNAGTNLKQVYLDLQQIA